jgi:hypothetical protein
MSFFETIHEKFDALFGDVWDFLQPMFKLFMSQAGAMLGQIALGVVMDIAKDPSMVQSGGLAKRQAAFDKIAQELKDKGLIVAESMINAAIETAVQHVKASGEKVD